MYDDEEKREAEKIVKELILDKMESGILKYPIKLLRIKIYLPLGLADLVRFYNQLWVIYIAILMTFFSFSEKILGYVEINRRCWCGLNNFMIIAYIVLKFSLRLKSKYSKKRRKCSNSYEQDHLTKQWFLKEEEKKKRSFWFWGMISWFVIYVGIYICFEKIWELQYIYPAIFIVFFYENWIRYEWMTKNEYYAREFNTIVEENEKTMFIMQEELKAILPSGSFLGYEASRDEAFQMTERELDEFLKGSSDAKNLLRAFCNGRAEILQKDPELLESALELLEGHSVLFKTPFYKDVDFAFLLPAYLKLVRGETILLVCSAKVNIEEMTNWVRNEIGKMNGLDWWRYDVYHPFHKSGNVVAVYCTEFLAFYQDTEYAEFRDKIGLIFLQEPSEYTENCLKKIRMLCNECREEREICLAVSSGSMEILDLLNWGFRENNVFSGQLWRPAKRMQVMYWKEELDAKADVEGRKWGIEAELLRYLIHEVPTEKIIWVSGCTLPVWDILWTYKRYGDINVGSQVVSEEFGHSLQLNNVTYIITEDFLGNYRKTAELFSSRGSDKSQVHVIVPEYLLRDYIMKNPSDRLLDEGVSKKEVTSERNVVWNIFYELLEDWIPVEHIKEELELHFSFGQFWKSYLENLLKDYVGGKEYIKIESRFIEEEHCHIYADEKIKLLVKKNVNLKFYLEGENRIADITTNLTYNTWFQKHLPGQYIVMGNKSFLFLGIVEKQDKFLVKIKRNSHMVNQKTYYRQIREYELNNVRICTSELMYRSKTSRLNWEFGEADITAKTCAYIAMDGFADFNHAVKYTCKNVPERKYIKKRYIKITARNSEEETLRIIATWLREAFYSLCPEDIDYLAVCMEDCKDSGSISNIIFLNKQTNEKEESICILEDRDRDSGILQDIFEKQDRIAVTMNEYMRTMDLSILQKFLEQIK